MTEGQNTQYFAILIGINSYPKRSLQGCENDAQSLKTVLERSLDRIQVKLLTSAPTKDTGDQVLQIRPTHENITLAFEETIMAARPGDLVYIHFSGHGTKEPPTKEFSNTSTGDSR
ncbi:hypothetical protein F4680DRAFT_405594 [Xylaria scruposa]|nr:hypothetical protein F4680DRAFT_405594 [Xylaria scruposa]